MTRPPITASKRKLFDALVSWRTEALFMRQKAQGLFTDWHTIYDATRKLTEHDYCTTPKRKAKRRESK